MIEAAIRSVLINNATVSAITTRCYPIGKIPQNPAYPLIWYQKASGFREHSLCGATGLAHPRLQIEAWDKTYSGAKTLAAAIRGALDGYSGTSNGVAVGSCLIVGEYDLYEDEIEVHRVVQDYMIYHNE